MSWTQIILIVVVGVFLLGPERIPTAVQWVTGSLKKLRSMAQGAQQQLNSELGPEIAEMRRQIAELQSLKELQALKDLKDLNPRAVISKAVFGTDEARTADGVAGLLGVDTEMFSDPFGLKTKPVSAGGPAEVAAAAAAAPAAASMVKADPLPAPTTADPLPAPTTADPLPSLEKPAADPLPSPAEPAADPLPSPAEPAADPLPPPAPAPSAPAPSAPARSVPVESAPNAPSLPSLGGDPIPAPGAR